MQSVVAQRTRHITVVLEEIYQGHNASAILRSCDCFGVQDIHAIEQRNRFKANDEIALGSSQWLELRRWSGMQGGGPACLAHLRQQGYKIVATSLGPATLDLEDVPIDSPLALCFGTEQDGLSDSLLAAADIRLRIPMFGFTQSFNVSVSAALCLHSLTTRLRRSQIPWALSRDDQDRILSRWLLAQTRGPLPASLNTSPHP